MQITGKGTQITAGGILAMLLIIGGCGQQTVAPKGRVPEVAFVTIQSKSLVTTTELTGRTSANLVADVRPQVSGIIQKRLFTEGADVRAGQILFQIDQAPFQVALDNANAALGRSEASMSAIKLRADRLRELVADKAVSQQEYDDAAAALKQIEADIRYGKATVEQARINLKYTSVSAPISGRIGRSNITEGALVTAQQPTALATIQRLDPMYVDVPQSTAELLRLQRSMEAGRLAQNGTSQKKVQLILEDGSTYPLAGTLQFRDVTVDSTTGSVILRAVFSNPRGLLLPGMFVRAVFQEGVRKEAILIPQQAVSRDPKGNPTALIVNSEGKVQQQMLTIDRAVGNTWLVTAGLSNGDKLIVEGMQKVKPGVPVKAVPFESETEKNRGGESQTTPPATKVN